METLVKYKFLLKIIGFQPHGSFGDIIRRFICCFALFSIDFLCGIEFVENISRDMNKAWAGLSVFLGMMTHVLTYLHILVSWKRIYSLLDALQDVVNESKK